jgi:hypothetical protein
METGHPKGISTLVALADGTVSLYFSTGGGFIGLGGREEPKRVSEELLEISSKYLSGCAKTTEYPMPKRGETIFYFFTFEGKYFVANKEAIMKNKYNSLFPLFYKAQELIATIRKVDEERKKDNEK